MPFTIDVCVIGGCGHVGLPLAISLAGAGLRVAIYDIDAEAVATVNAGRMPFMEHGAEEVLRSVIGSTLSASTDPVTVSDAEALIVIVGTPVDEHLNPAFNVVRRLFLTLLPQLRDGQCVILRSTVFPGTTDKVNQLLATESAKRVHVAFCPERVAEGRAMTELRSLPQIVSGCDERAVEVASRLFGRIAVSLIRLEPIEAELTKIFANVWRYIQFATANQFFMIAADYELDFFRIYDALTRDYPRMAGLPRSGFAAGPCLFKDTMQLAAAYNNNFYLGHAAMLVNEGLPSFVVRKLKEQNDLSSMTVGILGMAFKANCDDPRESLSYKLRKILEYEARDVLCTDVHIDDPSFVTLDEMLERADIMVLGAPHREYAALATLEGKSIIDIWNFFDKGTMFA